MGGVGDTDKRVQAKIAAARAAAMKRVVFMCYIGSWYKERVEPRLAISGLVGLADEIIV